MQLYLVIQHCTGITLESGLSLSEASRYVRQYKNHGGGLCYLIPMDLSNN